MQQLSRVISLIDRARAIVKNDSELARVLNVPRSRISDWRSGRYPCPQEYQVLLAEVGGGDPKAAALDALMDRNEGSTLGERLGKVLGKDQSTVEGELSADGRQRTAGGGCTPPKTCFAMKW